MHVPMVVLQVSVPASSIATQSASVLHWTHVPAMFELVVSPQTWFGGLLSCVQEKPAGSYAKHGMSGLPQQAPLYSHTVVGMGILVGSSTGVVPPEPSHTIFWQLPSVPPGATTVLPGKTHAPVASQSVAPQVPPVGLHAAVQQ
jgi:hypothetical protein